MELPIDNEELKELMDVLNESNHPDAMKTVSYTHLTLPTSDLV